MMSQTVNSNKPLINNKISLKCNTEKYYKEKSKENKSFKNVSIRNR